MTQMRLRFEDKPKKPRSFNDRMMMLLGVPVVLAWVAFSCLVIFSGLQSDEVLENIEGYTTLIAIIGGPALLILTSMLELWKQEQKMVIDGIPESMTGTALQHAAQAEHHRLMAAQIQRHEHELEAEKQKVALGLISSVVEIAEDDE